jgi:endonuclease YncB( thermonuclease family)
MIRVRACWIGALAMLGAANARAEPKPSCPVELVGTARVAAVADGRSLMLADGRELRLAGIEVPALDPADGARPEPGRAARDALAALVFEKEIVLKRLDRNTDRYGRLVAYAFTAEGEVERLVQEAMIAAGQARVAARIGNAACAALLLTAERTARAQKLGLWAEPYYDMRRAEDPAGVLTERGRFTLVEGKVVSVRESGGTIYVNFGRRWSEDFTVTILKRNERTFSAAGIEPKKLAGRRVRVRGWIEERGGPWIEAIAPEQIELAEDH